MDLYQKIEPYSYHFIGGNLDTDMRIQIDDVHTTVVSANISAMNEQVGEPRIYEYYDAYQKAFRQIAHDIHASVSKNFDPIKEGKTRQFQVIDEKLKQRTLAKLKKTIPETTQVKHLFISAHVVNDLVWR